MSNKLKRWSLWLSGLVMIVVGAFVGNLDAQPILDLIVPIIGFAMASFGLKFIKPEV